MGVFVSGGEPLSRTDWAIALATATPITTVAVLLILFAVFG